MPFITAGDPNLEFTKRLLVELDQAGCHLVEVGFPYSDPIADGPTIQASYTRALQNQIKVHDIFRTIADVREQIQMPVVAMVSFAIIHRFGVDEFLHAAVDAGISGLIVPDLPVDESELLADQCDAIGLNLVQLITPTTSEARAEAIINRASGFIYYVSIAGITGERTTLPAELADRLAWLKSKTDKPVCVGFGVSSAAQAKMLSVSADGVIVGSAIVRRIEKATSEDSAASDVVEFSKELVAATTGQ